jgi:hypothetical protein
MISFFLARFDQPVPSRDTSHKKKFKNWKNTKSPNVIDENVIDTKMRRASSATKKSSRLRNEPARMILRS